MGEITWVILLQMFANRQTYVAMSCAKSSLAKLRN
jgi:hypothetical protein